MLRTLGPIALAFVACAGPSTEVPPDEIQKQVVANAVALADGCDDLNDLTTLAWSWAQVCWHPTAPDLDRARLALEGCRAASVARGLDAVGLIPADVDVHATFELASNCPPPPPSDISQLQVRDDIDYAVEDGKAIEVVLTNFCAEKIDYGFAAEVDGKPPIVMQLGPLTRRQLSIPRDYGLRGRLANADASWEPGWCQASRAGLHLTFNADCRSCTVSGMDPLRRADCVEAGSCPPP